MTKIFDQKPPSLSQFGHQDGAGFSKELGDVAKESREIDRALHKLTLTVSGGALTLSIGFVLKEGGFLITDEVVPFIKMAWSSLISSMILSTICYGIGAHAMSEVAIRMRIYLSGGPLKEFPKWFDLMTTLLSWITAFLCILGLALLAYVAIELLDVVKLPRPLNLML